MNATNMTVEEAFKLYDEIEINYIWIHKCSICGKWYEEEDEEYGFQGDIEYFTGDFQREFNGNITLDDKIEQVDNNLFKFYKYGDDDVCPECDQEYGY